MLYALLQVEEGKTSAGVLRKFFNLLIQILVKTWFQQKLVALLQC